jgi:CPA2 family monovalent cation:H+ antiporter-2
VTGDDYHAFVGLALGSLLITPLLFNIGLRWVKHEHRAPEGAIPIANADGGGIKTAVVVGLGPVGQGVATYLHRRGQEVWLIDLSPVNLYPYAQQGFHTVAGDATDTTILTNAHARDADLTVVCVSDDFVALRIVQGIRQIQPRGNVAVRCRYEDKAAMLRSAGATLVISEETQMATSLAPLLDRVDMTRQRLSICADSTRFPLDRVSP